MVVAGPCKHMNLTTYRNRRFKRIISCKADQAGARVIDCVAFAMMDDMVITLSAEIWTSCYLVSNEIVSLNGWHLHTP